MKFFLVVAVCMTMAQAVDLRPRDQSPWNITNFQAYAMQHTGTSTLTFNLTSDYPSVDNLQCTNTTSIINNRIANYFDVPCQSDQAFSFNLSGAPSGDGSKTFTIQWRFTSHGAYVGNYTIPADQITILQSTSGSPLDQSQVYSGPETFEITQFYSVVYDIPHGA